MQCAYYSIIEEGEDKDDSSDGAQSTEEFVAPRDVILQLCTTFYTHARRRSVFAVYKFGP